HFSASSGVTEKSSLILVRPSKILYCVTSAIAEAAPAVGSSPGGSSTMPIVTLSLARAKLVEASTARPSVRRRRWRRRMERSGAEEKISRAYHRERRIRQERKSLPPLVREKGLENYRRRANAAQCASEAPP